MAIGAGDLIVKFDAADVGDKVTVTTPGSVANNTFSAAGDVNIWTNDDDAGLIMPTLVLINTSAAPAVGDRIGLYAQVVDVVNTTLEDSPTPDANFPHYYVGSWNVDNVDPAGTGIAYPFYKPVPLPALVRSAQQYRFFIRTNELTTISIDSDGWDLYIQAVSGGPHA